MASRGVLAGKGWALLLLTAVELVVFLDTTVLNVALPVIGRDLGLDEAGLGWVTNAYLLAFGGFMLLGGRAADTLGPRRVFAFGLTLFTVASAVAGFSDVAWLLISARALQGVGAAVVVPSQIALLTTTFTEPAARRRAFGVWGAMGAAGAAIGSAAGGPLTDFLGWPSIFLINLPVGIVALAFTTRLLPPDTSATAEANEEKHKHPRPSDRLDIPGAITGTAALLLIGYAIGALADPSTRLEAWILLGLGSALLLGFILIEARSPHPLMPLRLFRVREVVGSSLVNALVGAAHIPVFALLALYLQNTQDYSATWSGLAVLPVALMGVGASRTLVPYCLKRIGARGMLAIGLGLQAAAMLWLVRLPAECNYVVDILPAALVLGLGLPSAFVGVTVPAVTAVSEADTGITAGIVNTAQRVGAGLGVTSLLMFASYVTQNTTGDREAAYIDGLHAGFAAAAALAALGCILTLTVLRERPSDTPEADEEATPTTRDRETAEN